MKDVTDFDVAVTTYEMLSAESDFFKRRFLWQLVIVDEGHRLKKDKSQLSQNLKEASWKPPFPCPLSPVSRFTHRHLPSSRLCPTTGDVDFGHRQEIYAPPPPLAPPVGPRAHPLCGSQRAQAGEFCAPACLLSPLSLLPCSHLLIRTCMSEAQAGELVTSHTPPPPYSHRLRTHQKLKRRSRSLFPTPRAPPTAYEFVQS